MAAVVAPAGGFTVVTHTYPQHAQQPTSGTAPTVDHHKFLIGKPMALGTVQIMIGVVVLLFGVVTAFHAMTLSTYSGVMFWGAIIVRASLGMSIFSTITAGIAIILHSIDIFFIAVIFSYDCRDSDYRSRYSYICRGNQSRAQGIAGVMLVLSVLQFIVSICVSAFACKANCCYEPVRYMPLQEYVSIPTAYQTAASLNPQAMYLPNPVPPSCPPLQLSATPLITSEVQQTPAAFPPTVEPPAYSKS
ncbi:membrane-spanning 4-domains subfamily A member 4A-like [Engraulis encrasicolus]|uniref:membrane-spanning 4-domains subfamily A member 4A-like n=1 Tax=Engraulis encrasicolus TaxID=184585 RepID=UPI002FD05013